MLKNKGWLSENIVSLIAMFIIINTFCIFYLILLRQVKTSDSTTITIIQILSNVLMFILGYYYGSTKDKKDKAIDLTKPPDELKNN